jgi:hypothetical protein
LCSLKDDEKSIHRGTILIAKILEQPTFPSAAGEVIKLEYIPANECLDRNETEKTN